VSEWVTVETAPTAPLAEIVRGRLQADGIESVLRGDRVASTAGPITELNTSWSNPLGGVEVRVRQEDATEARELLRALRDDDIEDQEPRKPSVARLIFQFIAALWVAGVGFYLGAGATGNTAVGAICALVVFVGLLVWGRRTSSHHP
jgi:hypothetical protein